MTIMLYECPNIGTRTRLTAAQCERNKQRARKASKAKFLCTLRVRAVCSEPLIHLRPCLACPGVVALAEAGLIPPPKEYDGPSEWSRVKRSRHKLRIAAIPSPERKLTNQARIG